MNREDIIRMAREAGMLSGRFGVWDAEEPDLERFAALVAAAEREACAKALEELHVWPIQQEMQIATIEDCIAAIRARGQDV